MTLPSAPAGPKLTFVMPVHNAAITIRASLESAVRAAGQSEAECVVVDHDSTDGTTDILRTAFQGQVVVLHATSGTIGTARNIGARAAKAPVLAFIDADCVVPDDYGLRALAALDATGADAVGSQYALPAPPHWIEAAWFGLHRQPPGEVRYLNAGNFVIRREAFDGVGGFDETLLTGEDAELGERLRKAGCRIVSTPEVRAIHLGNPKSLRAFFRQQWWHGLGQLRGVAWHQDRPFLMTIVHLAAILAALFLLTEPGLSVATRASLALGGLFLAPAAAVAARIVRGGRLAAAPGGLVLYCLYFLARATALSSQLLGMPRPTRSRN